MVEEEPVEFVPSLKREIFERLVDLIEEICR